MAQRVCETPRVKVEVARVIGMHHDSCVAKHRLWARCADDHLLLLWGGVGVKGGWVSGGKGWQEWGRREKVRIGMAGAWKKYIHTPLTIYYAHFT